MRFLVFPYLKNHYVSRSRSVIGEGKALYKHYNIIVWPIRTVLNVKNSQKHESFDVGVRPGAPQNLWENIFRQRTLRYPRNRFLKIPGTYQTVHAIRTGKNDNDFCSRKKFALNNDIDIDYILYNISFKYSIFVYLLSKVSGYTKITFRQRQY